MNDETIIAAIRSRDAAAISTVIEKYSRLLWSVVSPILKDLAGVQDVEECVADVFIYLWQHPEKFDPARGSLKTWLSIIARSQALDRCRAISRHATLPLEDENVLRELALTDTFPDSEDRSALTAALDELAEPEHEILVRRYYYDQKPSQIARALDMPVKAVENRLYRAKQKLRKQLAK